MLQYAHPSEFGYDDFIDKWKTEKFDPDALVGLFKEAGAALLLLVLFTMITSINGILTKNTTQRI